MINDPPNELEALRPIKACNNADLLRFLNFTHALSLWHRMRSKYFATDLPDNGTLGIYLREATIDLLHKVYYLDETTNRWMPDTDFMGLFPKAIPLGGKAYINWKDLIAELCRIKDSHIGDAKTK